MTDTKMMAPLRWLHITDLHFGTDNESQSAALSSILAAITRHTGEKVVDLVLMTGDLAYSGRSGQYDAIRQEFVDRIRKIPAFAAARFIATPGNHDLDCDIELPISWKELGARRQEKFFHLGDDGRRTRGSRPLAFAAYRDFVSSARIESVDPIVEPAKLIRITHGEREFAFVSVVTAYFSDKEVSDFQKAPAPVHPIRSLTDGIASTTQIFVLGHHPQEWFTAETQRHLHSLLVEKSAVYIHGHEHQIRSNFGQRGLTSIGFGAAYQASNDALPKPYYRNSFAICELSEALHVLVISWDAENGQWRPEQHLPGDFIDPSDRLQGGYRLDLPSTKLTDRASHQFAGVAAALRREIQFERAIWLAKSDSKRWSEVLRTAGYIRDIADLYSLPTQALPAGHAEFRIRDQRGQHLIYAVSAYGDILNYEQIQSINTELDKQDYYSCIIVTLGQLASDARTLATQLAPKKPISVIERSEIIRDCMRGLSGRLTAAIRTAAEQDDAIGSLIFTESDFALLLQDRTANGWFQVVDGEGNVVHEASDIVVAVRRELPQLATTRYRAPSNQLHLGISASSAAQSFNKLEYLQKSRAYFDDVRYAPLAAMGFRFRNASLSEIYVAASADVGGSTKSSQNLTQALTELLDSLNLPNAHRDQLESQLRSKYGLSRTAEVGAARKLYQRYNNVVVLGDPGSGKTCFVKHELLEYCSATTQGDTWYSNHLPVYVSLAEAARLLDNDTTLLDICEIVSSRRGIELPKSAIEASVSEGRVAFFFDGLDEVGYIDKRIALLSEINQLVKRFSSKGNRFVLASRPAAVQPVDIPESLTYLHLKGLTQEEIRTLAGRVLTIRVGEHDQEKLTDDESYLIERLIEDTRNSPGIARIARNPLLLTLLVLIYANTGALSARRHLIYTQAIKTLVSVRGRQTREQTISEADLRIRLGALALGIFQREIAEIPKRSEVIALLAPIVARSSRIGDARSDSEVANAFLQEVAEATGLLAIHTKSDVESEDLVTFMHYSFLEYYTAAGLLGRNYLDIVPRLAGNPRWRDVTTLLFGVLSERDDITPLLDRLLSDDSRIEAVSKYKLVLALDCAAECDVPPEMAQSAIANAIYRTVSKGSGRFSARLRSEIAQKLTPLLRTCGGRIDEVLARGLSDDDVISAAAFADLVARVDEDIVLSNVVVAAFESCLSLEHPVTRAACLYAIEQRPELRSTAAFSIVKASLKGSIIEKHAALKAVLVVPRLVDELMPQLRDLLDDPSTLISAGAANSLLLASLKRGEISERQPQLEKVLLKLDQDAEQERSAMLSGITVKQEVIQEMLASKDPRQRELAVRYASFIKDDDQFVYGVLLETIKTAPSDRERAAALDTLRNCEGALDLVTIADTDVICGALGDSNRNVRIAAARLLGEMPDDEQVVSSLQNHLERASEQAGREVEFAEAGRSLARHAQQSERLRQQVLRMVLNELPEGGTGFGDELRQQFIAGLLSICESVGVIADEAAAWRLYRLAEDFKAPIVIRRHALRVFGSIVEPSSSSCHALVKLLKRDDIRLNEAVYSATASFVSHCHRKVEFVRKVYSALGELSGAICGAWERESARVRESIDPQSLRNIRDATLDLQTLIFSYEEFSERAKLQPGVVVERRVV